MLIWLLVNVVLSLLALGFAALNKNAPHRLRFHVCFVALLCWLVPWAQLPHWLPNVLPLDLGRVEQNLIRQTAAITQIPVIVIDARNVPLANNVMLLSAPVLLLALLLLAGLALFVWSVLRHRQRLRQLRRGARDGSSYWRECGIASTVPILLQHQISGAFSSGLFKPVIWVHEDLATSTQLPTLLRHELTHIAQHDNHYLLAITLVEKLLWWNPLAWYLGRQIRALQELSCDERCRAANADYPVQLAALMLGNLGISRSVAPEPLLLSANIFNNANLDIQRLKVLQRTCQMKPRHIVSAVATLVLAVATVAVVTAQPEPGQAGTERKVIFINRPDGAAPAGAAQAFALRDENGGSQFMRVIKNGDKTEVNFSFTDATLPIVLSPLVNLMNGPGKGAQVVRMKIAGSGNGAPPDANAGSQVQTSRLQGKQPFDLPVSDKLVLEDKTAATRQVTVSGDKLSFDEAIAKIAEASHCNIFKDKDTLVVDYCKPE